MRSHSIEELAVCCTSMCWVRMKYHSPSVIELLRLIRNSGFTMCDSMQLTLRCIRAVRGLDFLYGRCVPNDMSSNEKDAANLLASIWLNSCDSPPDAILLTEWLQRFFPKLDEIELAKEAEYMSRSLAETYDWWFPIYINRPKLRRTIIRQKSQR